MKAAALLALLHLMLVGSAALVSSACVRYMEARWKLSPLPVLPARIAEGWPWLAVASLIWFTYALFAEWHLKDQKWRHVLPLSLGVLYAGFIFLIIIGVIWAAFLPGGTQMLSLSVLLGLC